MDNNAEDDEGEQVPLVGGKAAEPSSGGHDAPPSDTLTQEAGVVWALAWPQSLSFLLAMMSQQANIAMVGHLGATELGAAALAAMFCNVTGFSIAYGGLTALDTLGAQAYGADQHVQVGVLAQRSLAIVTLLCIPVIALWCFAAGPLLALIGIEEAVAALTITYCRIFAFAVWPTLAAAVLQRYLSIQSIVKPYTMVITCLLPINIGSNYILVFGFPPTDRSTAGLGFIGSPISLVLCSWLLLGVLVGMLKVTQLHARCWGGWDATAALRDWGPLLRLGAAGTAGLMGEWWVWEICSALAATLGTVPLAAHACLQQLAMLAFVLLDGMAEAATIRVGNMLGAAQPAVARRAAVAAGIITGVVCVPLVVGVSSIGGNIVFIYTDDPAVAEMAGSMVIYYCCFMIVDAFNFCGGERTYHIDITNKHTKQNYQDERPSPNLSAQLCGITDVALLLLL